MEEMPLHYRLALTLVFIAGNAFFVGHRITLFTFEDTAIGEDGVVRLVDSSSAPDAPAPVPVPVPARTPTSGSPASNVVVQ